MEYTTNVKRIGGSSYLRLPPKLVRRYKFKDESEVRLRESNSLIIMDTNENKIDKYARRFLSRRVNLGGETFSREELYETDRY